VRTRLDFPSILGGVYLKPAKVLVVLMMQGFRCLVALAQYRLRHPRFSSYVSPHCAAILARQFNDIRPGHTGYDMRGIYYGEAFLQQKAAGTLLHHWGRAQSYRIDTVAYVFTTEVSCFLLYKAEVHVLCDGTQFMVCRLEVVKYTSVEGVPLSVFGRQHGFSFLRGPRPLYGLCGLWLQIFDLPGLFQNLHLWHNYAMVG